MRRRSPRSQPSPPRTRTASGRRATRAEGRAARPPTGWPRRTDLRHRRRGSRRWPVRTGFGSAAHWPPVPPPHGAGRTHRGSTLPDHLRSGARGRPPTRQGVRSTSRTRRARRSPPRGDIDVEDPADRLGILLPHDPADQVPARTPQHPLGLLVDVRESPFAVEEVAAGNARLAGARAVVRSTRDSGLSTCHPAICRLLSCIWSVCRHAPKGPSSARQSSAPTSLRSWRGSTNCELPFDTRSSRRLVVGRDRCGV